MSTSFEVKCRNLLISLFIIASMIGLLLLFASQSKNEPGLGAGFALFVWIEIIRAFSATAGITSLILRGFSIVKRPTNLIYVLIGELNFILGILFFLYFVQRAHNMNYNFTLFDKILFPLNLVIGVSILTDCLLLRNK